MQAKLADPSANALVIAHQLKISSSELKYTKNVIYFLVYFLKKLIVQKKFKK